MSTLKHNGSTSAWRKLRTAVLTRDMHTCTWCGQTEGKLEIDHIIPRVQGGDDSMANLQTLCQSCHIIKTKKDSVFLRPQATPAG